MYLFGDSYLLGEYFTFWLLNDKRIITVKIYQQKFR